jgi:hypothetical protein
MAVQFTWECCLLLRCDWKKGGSSIHLGLLIAAASLQFLALSQMMLHLLSRPLFVARCCRCTGTVARDLVTGACWKLTLFRQEERSKNGE